MEDAQRPDDEVPVSGIGKIMGNWTHLREGLQELGLIENRFDQTTGRAVIIKGNIICNLLQILKGRLGPN